MARSFGTHPEVVKFNNYTAKVEREWSALTPELQEKKRENWKAGLSKMRGIAMSFGISFNPRPKFMYTDKSVNITWVRSDFKGIGQVIYGLWDGKDHIQMTYEGKKRHVFNTTSLDFLVGESKDKVKAKQVLLELMIRFEGAEEKGRYE